MIGPGKRTKPNGYELIARNTRDIGDTPPNESTERASDRTTSVAAQGRSVPDFSDGSAYAQELQQLRALRMRENIVLATPVRSSKIRIHNEGNRHLQLAEQLVRKAPHAKPIDRFVALLHRED
jgi:hypothetical protein